MSRALSAGMLTAMNAPQTAEAFLLLVTIDHDDLGAPIRVTNDGQNVSSGGDTFVALPFEISLPEDGAETPPTAKLKIDNIDRQIVDAVRSISTPATVTIEIVMASTPDTIEASIEGLTMVAAGYDAESVEGALSFENVLNQQVPSPRFWPSTHPALFPG